MLGLTEAESAGRALSASVRVAGRCPGRSWAQWLATVGRRAGASRARWNLCQRRRGSWVVVALAHRPLGVRVSPAVACP